MNMTFSEAFKEIFKAADISDWTECPRCTLAAPLEDWGEWREKDLFKCPCCNWEFERQDDA